MLTCHAASVSFGESAPLACGVCGEQDDAFISASYQLAQIKLFQRALAGASGQGLGCQLQTVQVQNVQLTPGVLKQALFAQLTCSQRDADASDA